jgi:large subunit ribosomal protein L4
MSEVQVYDLTGKATSTLDVDGDTISKGVSPSLLHRAVVSYEANLRQGSANTKTRGERVGSGKKLWKQKGTGRARMGSIRSPLWRGGGVTFGPKPRDFRMKLSQNERRIALRGAVAGKLADNEIAALETTQLSEVKTKFIAKLIKNAGFKGRVLFVTEGLNADFIRASKNLKGVSVAPASELNALSVLMATTLVFDKGALEKWIGTEVAA